MIYADLKLCYVDGPWAYFSPQAPAEVYYSDWNDRPYEHNADTPHDLFHIAFEGNYDEPKTDHHNSPWSVVQINRGEIAWLRQSRYSDVQCAPLLAGCTLADFITSVTRDGGTVYLPLGLDLEREAP